MQSIKKYLRKYWLLIVLLVVYIFIFAILFKTFTNNDFIIGNDSLCQYKTFYEEWIEIIDNFIHNHSFNTYSFDMFLGTDFYSAMGYYCTGDIFLPIIYIFRDNIYFGLIIETILCIIISGITMSIFLDYAGIKNRMVVIYISILYAVAGHSVNYIQVYMFHRFYAFMPLLFYGSLKYFAENKKLVFILSTAILFMQNFYFMYPTLIVLFIYCLIECIKREYLIKEIFVHFLILLFSLIIGYMISAFVTLPAILYTYKNAIARSTFNPSISWSFKTVIGLLFSYMMSNPTGAFNYIFNTYNYYEDCQNMFMTVVPFVFLVYFFVKRSKKYRYDRLLFYILTIILLIKPLNSIMHGFAEPSLRWLFLYSFFALYLAALGIEEYNDSDKKLIIKIGVLSILVLAICFFVELIIFINNGLINNHYEHFLYIVVGIVISLLLFLILLKNKTVAYICSIVFVLLINLFFIIKTSNLCNTTAVIDTGEIDYQQHYEAKNYRYYISYLDSYYGVPHDCNNSLLYNFMTTTTYSSTIETVIQPFLDICDKTFYLDWNIEISDKNLLTMLGTKYYILGDKYKAQNNVSDLEKSYSLKALKNFDVYYNPDYKGFGYCAKQVKYFNDYSGNTTDFVDYVLVDDVNIDISKYQNCSPTTLDVVYMGEDTFLSNIYLQEDNILMIPIPNNAGWKIYVNDKLIKPVSVNGGFIGLELKKGFNDIKMNYSTPYLKVGVMMSCLGLIMCAFVIMKEERKS